MIDGCSCRIKREAIADHQLEVFPELLRIEIFMVIELFAHRSMGFLITFGYVGKSSFTQSIARQMPAVMKI